MFEFRSGYFIHIAPITIYQVERFIWTEAPDAFNLDKLFCGNRWDAGNGVTPTEGLDCLWAKGLSFNQASALAKWLGGRLPTREEWSLAAEKIRGRPALIVPKSPTPPGTPDERLTRALVPLCGSVGNLRELTGADFGELVSDEPESPFGRISAMFYCGAPATLTGSEGRTKDDHLFGFRCVIRAQNLKI